MNEETRRIRSVGRFVNATRVILLVCVSTLTVPQSVVGADRRLADAAARADVATVRQLLAAGAAVNDADAEGTTPLHWAVWADDLPTVEALLGGGASATARNTFTLTPLAIASEHGNAAIVRRLLQAGAQAEDVNAAGETALMTAVRSGSLETVRLLIEAGAQANDIRIEPTADMRYVGQGFEVTVPLDHAVLIGNSVDGLRRAFESVYQRRFGRSLGDMQIEVVSWRLRASSAAMAHQVRLQQDAQSGDHGPTGERAVYFAQRGGFQTTPVFSRNRLAAGAYVEGPAIIEEAESTVVVGPRARVEVDEAGNLVMRLNSKRALG